MPKQQHPPNSPEPARETVELEPPLFQELKENLSSNLETYRLMTKVVEHNYQTNHKKPEPILSLLLEVIRALNKLNLALCNPGPKINGKMPVNPKSSPRERVS